MRSSVYGRVGLAHLAWSGGDTFLQCYADEAPAEDILKCTCRLASLLVQKGRYDQALEILENMDSSILRVLRYRQYWTFSAGMLKLRRSLYHGDLTAASHLLTQIQGQGAPDIEFSFALSLLEIDFHTREKSYDKALDLVETLAKSSQPENTDIIAQIKLLNIKARILDKCGHPLQGFSITVRAASMAHRARILPCLWESSVILSHILLHLQDFSAAIKILEAIVPQVIECQDCDLAARTYSALVDAHMGLAGEEAARSAKRKEGLNRAMEYLDSALEDYRRIEDCKGQLEMLAKKATVMHLCGDYLLANDVASRYLDLNKEYGEMRF
jgi:anaphase-promoting complex subunit 5